MAFNSLIFVLVFLPIALAAYYASARFLPDWSRLLVLVLAGLAFYGRSQAYYVPLLLGSALFNYLVAVCIVRTQGRPRSLLLGLGVTFDIGLLLYFKYFEAIFETLADAFHHGGDWLHIVTPLAISFYTFQQVAFLLDIARGRTALGTPPKLSRLRVVLPATAGRADLAASGNRAPAEPAGRGVARRRKHPDRAGDLCHRLVQGRPCWPIRWCSGPIPCSSRQPATGWRRVCSRPGARR